MHGCEIAVKLKLCASPRSNDNLLLPPWGSFCKPAGCRVACPIRLKCCRHSDPAGHYWWEPQNCRLRRLTAPEARQCLNNRHLFFGGDSLTRWIAYSDSRARRQQSLRTLKCQNCLSKSNTCHPFPNLFAAHPLKRPCKHASCCHLEM